MQSMIHKCKVHCYTLSQTERETMGIEDPGKWLPFSIDLGMINAIKMATDERGESLYKCSTIYTAHGEVFILDTPYEELVTRWSNYIDFMFSQPSEDEGTDENDLEL